MKIDNTTTEKCQTRTPREETNEGIIKKGGSIVKSLNELRKRYYQSLFASKSTEALPAPIPQPDLET